RLRVGVAGPRKQLLPGLQIALLGAQLLQRVDPALELAPALQQGLALGGFVPEIRRFHAPVDFSELTLYAGFLKGTPGSESGVRRVLTSAAGLRERAWVPLRRENRRRPGGHRKDTSGQDSGPTGPTFQPPPEA